VYVIYKCFASGSPLYKHSYHLTIRPTLQAFIL